MTTPTKSKRLILVDGNALVHRAFHALPPLTTKQGELVNAVYGFTTLLLKAIADLQPDYAAVTFDLAGPTFRHEAYKEYKATRVKAPDELYAQFDRVKEVVKTLNIPIFAVKGFEADDVIGTIALQASKQQIETLIVTGDMDTLQLVSPLVKVYTMRKGFTDTVIYDQAAVQEKYGLKASQFVDFKALKGDASDNIPGVDGIGEKTASTLIQAFGSLDALYEFLGKGEQAGEPPVKITPRIREILLNGKDQAYQSQDLSRIVCDVEIDFKPADAILTDYDRPKAVALFQELEFRTLLPRLPATLEKSVSEKSPIGKANEPIAPVTKSNNAQSSLFGVEDTDLIAPGSAVISVEGQEVVTQVANADYRLINSEQELKELVKELSTVKGLVIDTETDFLNGPIIGCSISFQPDRAFYIPAKPEYLAMLKPILEDKTIAKYGHNIKYDYLAFLRAGITLTPLAFDSMIASYLLNPINRQHGLDALAFVELGVEKIPLTDLIGSKKQISLATVAVEKVAQYACEDADVTLKLVERFKPAIDASPVKSVYYEIDLPLIAILGNMEAKGIKIDRPFLTKLAKKLTKRTAELTAEIYEQVGQQFNINSPSQLSVILFEKLQLKHSDLKKTKTGISTAASELEKLKGMHPVIDLLFEYRELTKLLSTYIEILPTMADSNDRVHTSFNQTVAATGRLSSTDPGLQNIPIRTEIGKLIRQGFIVEEGNQLVSVDYSQIELRVVAHMAKDEALTKAFLEGRDIHQEVADTLGVDRRVGKTLNFAVLYGQGAYSTAGQLGIPMNQAKEYIDLYFQTYAGIRRFLDDTLRQAREEGFVETIFGRRRQIPEILSSNFTIRGAAERMATNMPIQGTAADLMKMAMIQIDSSGVLAEYQASMLLQVHDELVFEVPKEQVEPFARAVKDLMQNVYKLSVPLIAEVKVGHNWGEMETMSC